MKIKKKIFIVSKYFSLKLNFSYSRSLSGNAFLRIDRIVSDNLLQFDSLKCTIKNPQWHAELDTLIDKVAVDLGFNRTLVGVTLDKFLLYTKGNFPKVGRFYQIVRLPLLRV